MRHIIILPENALSLIIAVLLYFSIAFAGTKQVQEVRP